MNPQAYLDMADTESAHWWFKARRKILSAFLEHLNLPPDASILEVGCGTGGNLEMLASYGKLSAVEMDADALQIANTKTAGIYDIRKGTFPDSIPFHQQFDLICMFDVLEHIDHDIDTLRAAKTLLKGNGRIILTVPAYQWLWGSHDAFLHHKRRYSSGQLNNAIEQAGLRAVKLTYFNTLLFPLALAARLKDKLSERKTAAGTAVPPPIVNSVLYHLFSSERLLLKRLNMPFGLSLLGILETADAR